MTSEQDPFVHHPGLRGKITDPMQSFFREFTIERLLEDNPDLTFQPGWLYSDKAREASRAQTLAGRRDADLWVFGYGSLMWDPAFCFAEVRRAHVPDHARQFILKDEFGARGTAETPGLMAALDLGAGCDGILFRIERQRIETETEILWRREMAGQAYIPRFVKAYAGDEPIEALTFVADHAADVIDTCLTREEQVRFIATGTGFLGSSLEYLTNIGEHFAMLDIQDDDVSALLEEVEAYLSDR